MSIQSDIPAFIGTSSSHIHVHDEELSHIHDEEHNEELSIVSEESSTSRFSFFRRISQNERMKSPRFVQDLKVFASKKFIKNEEGKINKETTINKPHFSTIEADTIEADTITEASSDPSANNSEEKSLKTLALTRNISKVSESSAEEAAKLQPAQRILESIPGDPTADLQVGFPSDNHGKRGLLPTINKFQKSMRGNILRLKSERSLKSIDERKDTKWQEERDDTEAQHGRATPTKEECLALEKDLIEAKLALVLVREQLERGNTLMNRTVKERDWLRTQYSSLQFEHYAMKEQISSK